jgi:peptidoglycan hydrolase-like protein with peptidoglycan-binding domain
MGSYHSVFLGYIDNQFGNVTYQGVRNYQNARNLSVDGCVGSATWANMQSLLGYYETVTCGFGNVDVWVELGYSYNGLVSYFGGGSTGWTSQTDNPTQPPVTRHVNYVQQQSLAQLCGRFPLT